MPEVVSDIHVNDVVLVPLLLNLNVYYTFLYCWLWAAKYFLGILLYHLSFVDSFPKFGTMFSKNNWVACIKIFTNCVSVHKQPWRGQRRRILNPVERLTRSSLRKWLMALGRWLLLLKACSWMFGWVLDMLGSLFILDVTGFQDLPVQINFFKRLINLKMKIDFKGNLFASKGSA